AEYPVPERSSLEPERLHDAWREVNEVYRRRARFYDWSVNTYYLIGFRWWAYRRRAIAALQLGRGATVVEIGCGTGLNFGLVQQRIGPTGRLFGVDLCADMLERARQRVAAKGRDNVELIRARATDYDHQFRFVR